MRTPQHFLEIVQQQLRAGAPAILYAQALSHAPDPNKIWPEMRDPAFRDAVRAAGLTTGAFSPPNEMDDWTFVIYTYPPSLT